MNIDVTRDMLEYLGYQVISALSGKEAVDIYAVKRPNRSGHSGHGHAWHGRRCGFYGLETDEPAG